MYTNKITASTEQKHEIFKQVRNNEPISKARLV